MTVLKKGDYVVIALVAVAFLLSTALLLSFSKQGNRVVIKQDNQIIYDQSIDIDKKIDIGTNEIIVINGIVYMEKASCKNQVCVKTGEISKKGESIICLPNKVIIEIK